jgi:hypothetical protein
MIGQQRLLNLAWPNFRRSARKLRPVRRWGRRWRLLCFHIPRRRGLRLASMGWIDARPAYVGPGYVWPPRTNILCRVLARGVA